MSTGPNPWRRNFPVGEMNESYKNQFVLFNKFIISAGCVSALKLVSLIMFALNFSEIVFAPEN